jgi:hypothetical protein
MPDADNTTPQPIIPPSEAEQSYERVKSALAGVDITGASMRGVSVPTAATRLISLKAEYEALVPALSAYFKAEVMDPYRAATAALPDLIAALYYTDTMTRSAKVVFSGELAEEFERRLGEIKEDRQAGLKTLDIMEQLGLVSAAQAAHIRSGTGYFDLAADSTELGALFESKWDKVSALQALNEDVTSRITPERVQRLKNNGARFLELLAYRAAGGSQAAWERDRLAARVLLERHWTAIRRPARFHLDDAAPERVSLYAPLAGLR